MHFYFFKNVVLISQLNRGKLHENLIVICFAFASAAISVFILGKLNASSNLDSGSILVIKFDYPLIWFFPAFLCSLSLSTYFRTKYLKKINYIQTGFLILIVITTFVFCYNLAQSKIVFYLDHINIRRAFEIKEKSYVLHDIQAIKIVERINLPMRKKSVHSPHFLIEFKDNTTWSSRDILNDNISVNQLNFVMNELTKNGEVKIFRSCFKDKVSCD